jgi:DGQHR domain-containing protein
MSKNVEFLPSLPALEFHQSGLTFYVFQISAKRLLSIAYTSERTKGNRSGIQRGLRKDRLRDIGMYLQGARKGPPLLPNSIIVSLSSDSHFKDGKLYVARKANAEAFVLDGQHRLWAFDPKWSGNADLPILVSAFIDLEDRYKALVFRTINGEQRKINPSLVYDLIPMLRNSEWVDYQDRRAQELVEELNTDRDSPWLDSISMVGGGGHIISQSSFITAIKKLMKPGHIFGEGEEDFFEETLQFDVLRTFFKALSKEYRKEWNSKGYLLCKYMGVSATLNLLERIIADLRAKGVALTNEDGLTLKEAALEPYVQKLRQYDFSVASAKLEGRSYVGEGGVNELTRRICSLVFPNS